jgi:hypothetical protein
MPSVTKVNEFPPGIGLGSRAWCVSTNTGTSNGGSSPHQPSALHAAHAERVVEVRVRSGDVAVE